MKELFAVLAATGGVQLAYFTLAFAEKLGRLDLGAEAERRRFSKSHGLGVRPARSGQPAKIVMVPRR